MNEFKLTKNHLSLDEYLSFINFVVRFCFHNKDEKYIYKPVNKKLGIKREFLTKYTDFKSIGLEEDFEIYRNFSITEYIDQIDYAQIEDMIDVIDEEIEFKKQQLLHNPMCDLFNATKLNQPQDHKQKSNRRI